MSTVHTGAHIDALSHVTVGDDHHWFNGFHAARDLGDHGPLHADAATIPPIITRGVLIDAAGAKGVDALAPGEGVGRVEIECALDRQKVTVGKPKSDAGDRSGRSQARRRFDRHGVVRLFRAALREPGIDRARAQSDGRARLPSERARPELEQPANACDRPAHL
jgi:hypothetical protein